MISRIIFNLIIILVFLFLNSINISAQAIVYATGLQNPIGIEIDGQGRLWVCEQGTANDDGRVSIITTDGQVHPFLTGLPSELIASEISGPTHCYFDIDGKLLILMGEGTDTLSQSILVVDTSGFVPGNPPLTRNNIEAVYLIDDQGFSQSNPFTLTIGPNNDYYIVDAAGNAIVKRERSSGINSVFAAFPDIPNPRTPLGPPMIDAVPTSILFDQANLMFYVSSLTGFPFPDKSAKIYKVDQSGIVSNFQKDLTTIVEIQFDPKDNKLLALKYADFGPPFFSNTGTIIKISTGSLDTIISGLNLPSAMRVNQNSEIFVSAIADGQILKINTLTDFEDIENPPQSFSLAQNYPNPFNPATQIEFSLPAESSVKLIIYDLLGSKVITLVDEVRQAGNFSESWNGQNEFGYQVGSGIYFYRIEAESFVQTRKLMLLK